jgi:hypothetical protein
VYFSGEDGGKCGKEGGNKVDKVILGILWGVLYSQNDFVDLIIPFFFFFKLFGSVGGCGNYFQVGVM